MAGTYRYSSSSKRAMRRDRHKYAFKPANTGKPSRTQSAGTRQGK